MLSIGCKFIRIIVEYRIQVYKIIVEYRIQVFKIIVKYKIKVFKIIKFKDTGFQDNCLV